jgi:hypothetical protein
MRYSGSPQGAVWMSDGNMLLVATKNSGRIGSVDFHASADTLQTKVCIDVSQDEEMLRETGTSNLMFFFGGDLNVIIHVGGFYFRSNARR